MVIDFRMIVITLVMTISGKIIMTVTERVGIAIRLRFLSYGGFYTY
jgi:hypothetical protein